MAENQSSQEKTEQATPQKLQKAREEGQVTRSRDLATMVSLLATLLILRIFFDYMLDGFDQIFTGSYLDFTRSELTPNDVTQVLLNGILTFILILLPLLIAPLVVVPFGMIPSGWMFASKNFHPKLSKLNPLTGLKRIVSMQNLTDFLKSFLKVLVLIAMGWLQMVYTLPRLIALQKSDLPTALGSAFSLTFDLLIMMMAVFVVFAAIDVPLQRFLFMKKMRMTKQEVKEEYKNREGKPEVKARIKRLQRQVSQRQISKVLKDADVVITNPLHFAVALKYDLKKAQAHYVIAKGHDETAQFIREKAMDLNIEVVPLPPLARAVYFTTQVNQQIPTALYQAVAHVLTYVLQLKAYRRGARRAAPVLPKQLPIPSSLANRAST